MSYSNNITEHKFLTHILSPKKSIMRDIDVPPRKLLSRGSRPPPLDGGSPRFSSVDEAMLQRFLPCNGGDDDDVDPYASDHFRMFEFKVRRCTRSRSHDWTDCPFAHPGEKARRRDPRRYHYSGAVCAEYRRGGCLRGDSCEFAHGVFECWLHPARYRTEACKDGRSCKRKVCFFAHTARELRVLPLHSPSSPETSPAAAEKFRNGQNHCLYCCHSTTNSSPTSTLLGMSHLSSPPHSPPLSPIKHRSLSGLSPFSRFLNSEHSTAGINLGPQLYKEALNELISSLEGVKFTDSAACSPVGGNYKNAPWTDGFEDHHQQQQFILSPSTSNLSNIASGSGSADLYNHDVIRNNEINVWSCDPDPDLGWVNDLLM